jgi:hypothetical protein
MNQMSQLHDALTEIADSALGRTPLGSVDLIEPAIRTGRRRRRLRLAAAGGAVAAATALVVGAVALPGLLTTDGQDSASGRLDQAVPIAVPPSPPSALPADGLPAREGTAPTGVLVYKISCAEDDVEDVETCEQWRLVATDGSQWRLADAYAGLPRGQEKSGGGDAHGPLALTTDGRRVAYYQTEHDRLAVRDLATGEVEPLKVELPEKRVERERIRLTWSPEGRWLAVSYGARAGEREPAGPGQVVDTRTGSVRALPELGSILGISGGGKVVMWDAYFRRTGSGRLIVSGPDGREVGSPPARAAQNLDRLPADVAMIMSPDGRRLAAMVGGRLDTFDVDSGLPGSPLRIERPKAVDTAAVVGWSGTSSVLVAQPDKNRARTRIVAVDTGTRKVRVVALISDATQGLAVAGEVIGEPRRR